MIPKKSLGQNFLIDKNICRKIVNLVNFNESIIIEIGPGTGQMTDEIIIKKAKKIILIEKDKNLCNLLKIKYKKNKNISIINKDVFEFNFNKYSNIKIISNLPYNISTKIIFKLLKDYNNIDEMIFMIQKEVAEKIKKIENFKNNKLSFFINILTDFKIIFNISNKVFYPKPKIKSSVVKITPNKNNIIEKNLFQNFINQIFKFKRKKISNVLNLKKIEKKHTNLLKKRAEDLSDQELLKLFIIY